MNREPAFYNVWAIGSEEGDDYEVAGNIAAYDENGAFAACFGENATPNWVGDELVEVDGEMYQVCKQAGNRGQQ